MQVYNLIYIITFPLITYSIYQLMEFFFAERKSNKKIMLISFLCYNIALTTLTILIKFPFFILIITILSIFLLSYNYKSDMQKRIIKTVLIYSILLVIEVSIFVCMGNIVLLKKKILFESEIGIILIRTITLIVSYLIKKCKRKENINYRLPNLYYVLYLIISLGSLYLCIASLEYNYLSLSQVIFRGAILITINIAMIIIDEKICIGLIAQNEKNIFIQQNIAYERQAELMEKSTKNLKSFRHDMKNHFIALSELCKQENIKEIENYVDKMMREISYNTELSKSGNFIIDSIINSKLENIKNQNITAKVEVKVPKKINIEPYDLTVILGNLIDNAVTATLNSVDKKIDISITYLMGNIIILISNTYDGKIIFERGEYKTTKTNKSEHGIGLKNIKKSVEKYNGDIEINHTEKIFSIEIVLPAKTK